MQEPARQLIRIAAALIVDDRERLLLVRKAGTSCFMQAGGKIESGETPLNALRRELQEEIGVRIDERAALYLGRFRAPAANEVGSTVEAEVYAVRPPLHIVIGAEIAEAVWVDGDQTGAMVLAPLTRDHLLPLAAGGGGLFNRTA